MENSSVEYLSKVIKPLLVNLSELWIIFTLKEVLTTKIYQLI